MMDNKKMAEMMEFFEAYEMFKAMKNKRSVSTRTTTANTKKSKKNDIQVNELPFNEDLKPSKPKKMTYSKNKNNMSFEEYIQACIKGTKVYPDEKIVWKNEIQHIKGIGYIAVLDSWTKKDTYNVLKECCLHLCGNVYEKSGFAFKTKSECKAFMGNYSVVSGRL